MAFLTVNGIYVPVEEGSASMETSARSPERSYGGQVIVSGFGVGRIWKFKTGFLTMEEAKRLRVMFTGFLPGLSGIDRYASTWAGRGAPDVPNSPYPPPYLHAEGELIGEAGGVKTEGKVAGTTWLNKNIAVMDLELYEVGLSSPGFDTTPDTTPAPSPTPIPDPNASESPYGQHEYQEATRSLDTDNGYMAFNSPQFKDMFDANGQDYYDASGNLLYPKGTDVPGNATVYDLNGNLVTYRVKEVIDPVLGPVLTTDPADDINMQGSTLIHFQKRFVGPGVISFNYWAETDPNENGITCYVDKMPDEWDTEEYRFWNVIDNVANSGGNRLAEQTIPAGTWMLWFGWNGWASYDGPPGNQGANTFKFWNLQFTPAAIDAAPSQADEPTVEDPSYNETDGANTVPAEAFSTFITDGWFGGQAGDTFTDPRTGLTYTSAAPWEADGSNSDGIKAPELQPGQMAIVRKRLGNAGTFDDPGSFGDESGGVALNIRIGAGNEGYYRIFCRVVNLNTNFTFASLNWSRPSRIYPDFDVARFGVQELQLVAICDAVPPLAYYPVQAWGAGSWGSAGTPPKIADNIDVPEPWEPPVGASVYRDSYYAKAEDLSGGNVTFTDDTTGWLNQAIPSGFSAILYKKFVGPGGLTLTLETLGAVDGVQVLLSAPQSGIGLFTNPGESGPWTRSGYLPDGLIEEVTVYVMNGGESELPAGRLRFADAVFDGNATPPDPTDPPSSATAVYARGYYTPAAYASYAPLTDTGSGWSSPAMLSSELTLVAKRIQGPGTVDFSIDVPTSYPGLYAEVQGAGQVHTIAPGPTSGPSVMQVNLPDDTVHEILIYVQAQGGDLPAGAVTFGDLVVT